MAGGLAECDDRLARMQRVVDLMGGGESEHLLTAVSPARWRGTSLDVLDALTEAVSEGPPLSPVAVVCLLRAGEVQQARRFVDEHPFDLEDDTWLSPLLWTCAAEAALGLGDAVLGRRVHHLMTP
jgi:hypothetical protein